jgi:NADH:ubiquinone oxidoreductase subunit K
MISYGLAFYLIGMIAFIFHQGNNILMMIISLELILLSVGIILVNATK